MLFLWEYYRFFLWETPRHKIVSTHTAEAQKLMKKTSVAHAWAHVKKIQIGVLIDVLFQFFSRVFLLISCNFLERKEELSNTCWAMASLQLTVATLEGAEFENSDRRRFQKFVLFGSHTWIPRSRSRIFQVFFQMSDSYS